MTVCTHEHNRMQCACSPKTHAPHADLAIAPGRLVSALGHGVGCVEPNKQKLPSRQSAQAPLALAYVPAAHPHAVLLPLGTRPPLQLVHRHARLS